MKNITLIFPNQLFEKHPALNLNRPVILVEEFLFFKIQQFHKQRLILLRAAMKQYAAYLEKKGFEVKYIDARFLNKREDLPLLFKKMHVEEIHLADCADDWLVSTLNSSAKHDRWKLFFYDSPMFLCSETEIRSFFKSKKFSMASFYAYQRKKLSILMFEGSPVGGKYSFDIENRKKLPKQIKIPETYIPKGNSSTREAIEYVKKEFPHAIGSLELFLYPTTFDQARKALFDFIEYKLFLFGDYEDAMSPKEPVLFHSLLSPLLNIGLLTPAETVEAVLDFHKKNPIPLNSLEGFLRQIIGWREFMRAAYLLKGREMRTANYFHHSRPIHKRFWEGKTGILPIDATIKKVLATGYCHHIERLMVLGNFLLLTETNPDAVYEWFMSCFVDAYDWVMVPNVYGMSQYADKGTIVTKPYISGASYILKMSDFPKGEWVEIWNGLYWRFLHNHQGLFQRNPRTALLIRALEKNKKTLAPKIAQAEAWLAKFAAD